MTPKTISQSYDLEESAGYLIYRVGRLIRQGAMRFMANRGMTITPEQWGLLINLSNHNGIVQSDLADRALQDHANITRMLDGLEKQGLVERSPNPKDRRSHLIHITKDGARLVDDVLPLVLEEKGSWFEGLDRNDLERLVAILKKIEANIGLASR